MTCEHFQEQFVEYLLCELSALEELAVRQHLQSGCVACNAEFLAIRDGAELLFSVAPQAELTQVRRDTILARALAASPDARPQLASSEGSSSRTRATSRRNSRLLALQGLLAVVAGFALVLAIPVPHRSEPIPLALDHDVGAGKVGGLRGVLPAPDVRPNFVSFENMTQRIQPKDRSISGFMVIDTQAGEIHLLGRQLKPALPGSPALDLQIVTANGNVQYPLKFNSSGLCKSLVPLPQERILKIEIINAAPSSTETPRATNRGRVD